MTAREQPPDRLLYLVGCMNRECILDVVPRGMELKPLEIKEGVWGSYTHLQIIPINYTTHLLLRL
jgi:hypothetical protein